MRLVVRSRGQDQEASIGEAAHIVAHNKSGPRGDAGGLKPSQLDSYANLILLCANHHAEVDAQPSAFTVEVLHEWKAGHEAWVESVTSEVLGGRLWTGILQEQGSSADANLIYGALGPENHLVSLLELRHAPSVEGWETAAQRESRALSVAIADTPADRRRFAVFSLGKIPLAVQLGYILSDRVHAEIFQYHRFRESWSWPKDPEPSGPITWTLRDCDEGLAGEAAIRVSLSAAVLAETCLRCGAEIDIQVPEPWVGWLCAPSQLAELARIYAEALGAIRARGCRRIHLYYAGPAAAAIAFGRAYNPTMNPELVVYEYKRGASPSYHPALVLNQ